MRRQPCADFPFVCVANLTQVTLKISFSAMTNVELEKLGVVAGRLDFDTNKLDELAERLTPEARIEIPQLQARILDIYDHVNMDVRLLFFVPWPVMIF